MENKPYVIGLDLGGTNSAFGIVDAEANVVATTTIRTGEYRDVDVYVDSCCKALAPLVEKVGGIGQIKGLGIGAPNGNYYNGTIELAPNLPWKGIVPLAKMFQERLGIPVVLTNDADGSVLYESQGIKPGQYIDKIRLNQDLPAGEYSCTATEIITDPETLEDINQVQVAVRLIVKN